MPDSDFDGLVDCFDVEVCDSLDNDGDGLVDEEMPDTDGDGGDYRCRMCDGLDNDGDGLVDEDMLIQTGINSSCSMKKNVMARQ